MNENDCRIMCEECLTKGLITDEVGRTFIQDENQINHPHEHKEPLAHVYQEFCHHYGLTSKQTKPKDSHETI